MQVVGLRQRKRHQAALNGLRWRTKNIHHGEGATKKRIGPLSLSTATCIQAQTLYPDAIQDLVGIKPPLDKMLSGVAWHRVNPVSA